ncbi:hypothetical protein JCM8202_003581 [Rhodotorula sphaerocarpa]
MMRFTLLSAAAISAVTASVSTSVFPNSLCQGASDSLGGLVGVGKVTLANGDVEVHCGCPSDNLADFEACPSSTKGESVCNSVYDMASGQFSASDCLGTIVNEVVTHADECADRGAIGISTVDGESKCACSSEVDAEDFSACVAPANGKATCTTTDPDFLGASNDHTVQVECGVVCDQGFTLTPAGTCTSIAKRNCNGGSCDNGNPAPMPNMPMGPGPVQMGSSSRAHPMGSSTQGNAMPTWHPHQAHPTTGGAMPTTTSYSYKYHHGHSSMGHGGNGAGYHTSGVWMGASSSMPAGNGGMWNGPSMSHGNSWGAMPTTTPVGSNHAAHPTTTPGMMAPASSSPYSYKHHNGHSTMGSGSPSSSSLRVTYASQPAAYVAAVAAPSNMASTHWAHKRNCNGDSCNNGNPAPMPNMPMGPGPVHYGSSSRAGPSQSMWHGGSSMPANNGNAMPTWHPHQAHPTSGGPMAAPTTTTTSYSYKYHHHQNSMAAQASSSSASSMGMAWQPMPSMGPSGSNHNAHPWNGASSSPMMGAASPSTTAPSMRPHYGSTTAAPSMRPHYGSTTAGAMATPGPSQRAMRRSSDEYVFSDDVCAQDERTCPGDIMCVRLDDVTECGGCHATGDAVNCLEIPGASSVSCLRGGCVVRSCQTGYFQTAEGRCERL